MMPAAAPASSQSQQPQPQAWPPNPNAAVSIRGLFKHFDRKIAVNGLALDIPIGSFYGLVGPNGAGKTTTFYMIVGIIKPDSGTVTLDGQDISGLPMYMRARAGIGYLPQEASIFRKMTVEENILAILEANNVPEKERYEKMNALVEEFHIDHIRQKQKARNFPADERRPRGNCPRFGNRPGISFCWMSPFAGIDPIAVADIQNMIAHLAQRGIGILITDHNVRETLSIVDKAYILANGEILLHGDSETIANDPVARKYYLGENFSM